MPDVVKPSRRENCTAIKELSDILVRIFEKKDAEIEI